MKTYQQGDVILEEVKSVEGEKLNHLVLAEGEATGHSHQITAGVAVLFANGEDMFMKTISENAKLKHQEHKEIDVPKGNYRVGTVQEYDHFAEEVRKVQD